ncbi:DUF418 domain-containing protein [Sphingomonas sp.]|jgi:uncharacterized protein|uniref:DUF418 domain-containing protein n=1 Tax=Sphingomonas sp. TaxID=28214 RepID=UPI002ED8FAC0
MADGQVALAPVAGKARIDVLDILRGIAILGIFFMNIPFMAAEISKLFVNVTAIGWTPMDQFAWWGVHLFLEGTQRGLLEMLFGAGLMVFAAKAMTPDGPVAVADLYQRRNLWLIGFGLLDIFVLLWAGDILHIYGLAALLLFPFRRLGPKWLLALGMGFALFNLVSGGIQYVKRVELVQQVEAAQAKQAANAPLSVSEKKTLEDWAKKVERRRTGGPEMKQTAEMEKKGHSGGFIEYAQMNIGFFVGFVLSSLPSNVAEAFCMMLVGIALWKWQVIQGGRSGRFYLVLMAACYVSGITLRWIGGHEILDLTPAAKIHWATAEFARMAMSVGHVALINLLVKGGAGRSLLAPFKAAGRMAFSLYFLQNALGMYILYAPWGPGLWARQGWADMAGTALMVIAVQLVLANVWMRYFSCGPLEWAWRSLAYVKWQPFRKRPAASEPIAA